VMLFVTLNTRNWPHSRLSRLS